MDITLTGQFSLVCGSTQGIGHAAAMALAGLGASVTLAARNEERLRQALQALDATQGQQHSILVADFSKPEHLQGQLAAHLADTGRAYTILVNNTGGPPAGPAHTATPDAFRAAFEQHLICNHVLVTALLPGMQAAGHGRIINIISTSVKTPLPNLGVSNTIRGAVANWAKTLANELGRYNITVNNVLPGATSTERLASIVRNRAEKTGMSEAEAAKSMQLEIPMQRFAEPAEVANAIAFLASPAASYITGINLPVDGGRTPNL
jgi:3-oxoacyl-[acyl-carrier protein] reductase